MPKFTIMIPNYNQEELIVRALDSIPTRGDIEVIIVDDNSTDNSLDKINRWKEENKNNFSKITIKKNDKNMGCGYGKNLMYTLAEGEYIVTLDSDDYFLPRFNKVLEEIYKHNEDVIFYGNEIDNGELWCGTDRKATWSYFVRNQFLKEHNINYEKEARRAGDHKMMMDMNEFNPSITKLDLVGYHYTYPRKGSIVWNYENGVTDEYGNRNNKLTSWY